MFLLVQKLKRQIHMWKKFLFPLLQECTRKKKDFCICLRDSWIGRVGSPNGELDVGVQLAQWRVGLGRVGCCIPNLSDGVSDDHGSLFSMLGNYDDLGSSYFYFL